MKPSGGEPAGHLRWGVSCAFSLLPARLRPPQDPGQACALLQGLTQVQTFLPFKHIFHTLIRSLSTSQLHAILRYLGCTEVGSLAKEEQANHAFHLALAALLGDRIFNFGQ